MRNNRENFLFWACTVVRKFVSSLYVVIHCKSISNFHPCLKGLLQHFNAWYLKSLFVYIFSEFVSIKTVNVLKKGFKKTFFCNKLQRTVFTMPKCKYFKRKYDNNLKHHSFSYSFFRYSEVLTCPFVSTDSAVGECGWYQTTWHLSIWSSGTQWVSTIFLNICCPISSDIFFFGRKNHQVLNAGLKVSMMNGPFEDLYPLIDRALAPAQF